MLDRQTLVAEEEKERGGLVAAAQDAWKKAHESLFGDDKEKDAVAAPPVSKSTLKPVQQIAQSLREVREAERQASVNADLEKLRLAREEAKKAQEAAAASGDEDAKRAAAEMMKKIRADPNAVLTPGFVEQVRENRVSGAKEADARSAAKQAGGFWWEDATFFGGINDGLSAAQRGAWVKLSDDGKKDFLKQFGVDIPVTDKERAKAALNASREKWREDHPAPKPAAQSESSEAALAGAPLKAVGTAAAAAQWWKEPKAASDVSDKLTGGNVKWNMAQETAKKTFMGQYPDAKAAAEAWSSGKK